MDFVAHTRAFSLLLAVSVLAGAGAALAQQAGKSTDLPQQKLYWVFLTTGKSTQGVERAEIEAMQAAHIANFGRLHADGKLFAAGPMADPDKKKRGIVVVTAADVQSLPQLFEPDPYVSQGYMTLDATEMEIAVGEFYAAVDPANLAEHRLVLLEDAQAGAAELTADERKANLDYCESIHAPDRLCFAAWLQGDAAHRRAVLIFRQLDDDALAKLLNDLPAVKSQAWKSTTFPLYLSDGVVR